MLLCVGNQLLEIADREVRAGCEDICRACHQDDGLQILGRVVGQALHQTLIDSETIGDGADRMPVRRFGSGIHTNYGTGTWLVVDDD